MRKLIIISGVFLLSLGLADGQSQTVSPPPATATSPTPLQDAKELMTAVAGLTPAVTAIPGGKIDWSEGLAYAQGTAKPAGSTPSDRAMAGNAARLIAARNAVLIMGGIDVGSGGKFTNLESGQLTVDAIVKDFQADEPVYNSDGTVTVGIRLPFYGVTGIIKAGGAKFTAGTNRFAWPDVAAPVSKKIIVIDARGSGCRPCVYPRIVDSQGSVLFDASDISAAGARSAIFAYSSAADSEQLKTVDSTAILLRAVNASAGSSEKIVLNRTDVDLLIAAGGQGVLKSARVVVVVSSPTPSSAKAD